MNERSLHKKIICLFLIIMIIIFQGGCWSRREINDLAIVLATGVDQAPGGNIRLTVQIARPRAFGGGGQKAVGFEENNVWVVSQDGETVLDAQRYLEAKVSRKIYWGHNVILVFGKEMAQQGLRSAINFFVRSPDARETIWVLAARGKAEDVLNSHSQLENTSAQSAGSMIRSGVSMPVMLKDLSMMLASKGTNPVLPVLELTPSGTPQGPGLKENLPEAPADSKTMKNPVHGEITVTGTAVFKDDKLIGWLDMPETRGLLWLKNKMKKGVITVPSMTEPGKKISVNLTRGSTRVEPFYDGQNIWFDIKIKLEGELLEQQSTEDLTRPEIFKAIKKEMARTIEARARNVLDKAQIDYGVDIFGFGDAFHKKYKKEWALMQDNWNEAFANANTDIKVEAHIRHTGLTTKRISPE